MRSVLHHLSFFLVYLSFDAVIRWIGGVGVAFSLFFVVAFPIVLLS